MENFDTPYYSRSISEFWKALAYLAFQLVPRLPVRTTRGSRVPKWRWSFNLLVTFAISGLWHGANWTYVVWGLLNGLYLVMSGLTSNLRRTAMDGVGLPETSVLRKMLQVIVTFGLVCIGWIFFRAQNLNDALYILGHFWTNWDFRAIGTEQFLLRQMPIAIAAIAVLEIGQFLHGRVSFQACPFGSPWLSDGLGMPLS